MADWPQKCAYIHVFSNYRTVLRFHQSVIIASPWPALRLLNQQFAEHLLHIATSTSKLAGIAGMKAAYPERELSQHRQQRGFQPGVAN